MPLPRSVFVLATLLLLSALPAGAQVARLLPADEAASEPSFFAFRARLLEAVARRDTAFLYAHTAPDVHVSFGAGNGLAALKHQWSLAEDPAESDLWPTLARVLGGGGRFRGERFVAPYVYAGWPDALDAFQHAAVVGEDVRVRSRPSLDGDVLAKLSFAIVPVERGGTEHAASRSWTRVRLDDGRTGYVASEYLWSPIGYRAGFEKQSGCWRMTFFIAGD